MTATPQQVRQWSEEVARDPGSLAFLALAGAYREQGRREPALRLCIRGLERHPTHVEAHVLLGVLYEEGGDLLKAFDEWDIALHLAPEHADARRRIGLLSARREDWAAAVRHLERVAGDGDAQVAEALAEARRRAAAAPAAGTARTTGAATSTAGSAPAAAASAVATAPAPTPPPTDASTPAGPAAGPSPWEALQGEFQALAAERGIEGVVLLDASGYVLAGEMRVAERDRAADVAATLSGASTEAERAVRHLAMGAWRGILLETPDATVRLVPLSDGGMLAVAARREVPTGWVLRVAGRAQEAAERYLGAGGAA